MFWDTYMTHILQTRRRFLFIQNVIILIFWIPQKKIWQDRLWVKCRKATIFSRDLIKFGGIFALSIIGFQSAPTSGSQKIQMFFLLNTGFQVGKYKKLIHSDKVIIIKVEFNARTTFNIQFKEYFQFNIHINGDMEKLLSI